MVKSLNKLGTKVNFCDLIKNIYKKPATKILHDTDKCEAFPQRSGKDIGFHHSFLTSHWEF